MVRIGRIGTLKFTVFLTNYASSQREKAEKPDKVVSFSEF